MKNIIAGWLVLFGMMPGFSQSLEFVENSHDFGEIEEDGGDVQHTFRFVNTKNDPIKIAGVRTSCGCTTPDWSREFVPVGDTGYVVANFNPFNRPGVFQKSLRVTLSDGEGVSLYISGVVKPRARDITDELPAKVGNLRMRYRAMNMGRIKTNSPFSRSFDIYNEGETAMEFLSESHVVPDHISLTINPPVLPPNTKGKIEVSYDPKKYSELGFTRTSVELHTSDVSEPLKALEILATVEEYFPPMTDEEIAEAPQLLFETREHDFGTVKQSIVETDFPIKNGGKQTLNIRSVKSNCACIETELPETDISPGESLMLKIRFLPEGRRGRQYKTITVFSNDPVAPTQVISVKANVSR